MGKHLVQKEKKEKRIASFSEEIKKQKEVQEPEGEKKAKKRFDFHREKKGSGIANIVIAAILLVGLQFLPLEGWMLKAAYALVLVFSAFELGFAAFEKISEGDYFAVENAVILAALLSFAVNLDVEAVIMILLFRISLILIKSIGQLSREKLEGFGRVIPVNASVETADGVLRLSPEHVNPGDVILVEAGEIIPLDGIILEGISTLDTSAVSGQSSPWAVTEGHRVYSGCKNLTSPIKVKVSKPAEQSTARTLVKLAESSVEYPSRQEKFVSSISRYFTPALIATAVVLTVALSVINKDWGGNITRAIVLIIASCSSTAFLSVGFAYVKCIGIAAEKGVFVKGADCVEAMARSEIMVFDKTGVITEGRYIITDVFPNKVSEHELLTMAATAERFSRHPIAAVLREAVGKIDIDYKSLQIEEIPGRGVSAFVADKQVYVGNAALLEEHGIKCVVPTKSGAAIHVAVDYKYWGHILITDRIRRGAFDSLENLRACGIKKLVLLTGDVLSVAKPLASKLNFDMLRAELKPSEKVSAVDFLMSNRGDSVALAFVDDGRSEEQIMSRVDVGIAMGALGSDKALATADVLIMDRDIKKLPAAVSLSRLSYRVALENILAWFVINALTVILGAIGVLPVIAAVIMEFVLICAVLLNTLRIK